MGDEVVSIDHEVDVTEPATVLATMRGVRPEAVYHLAALAHVGRSWVDPMSVARVNTLGTLSVLEAARSLDPPPVVLLTSSAEVYGSVPEEMMPITEAQPLAPVTPYAASKVAAEYFAVQAYLAHGLPVIRVRPFNHIGPGQGKEFVVPALAARIVYATRTGADRLRGGNLAARRDLTYVRDVVRAYRLLVVSGRPGGVYNVCSGCDVAIAAVAERMLVLAGASLRLVVDPDLVRSVDVPVVRGDAGLLWRDTGWEPEHDLDTTLADVLAEHRGRLD